jgi:hypothetical protein
MTIIKETDTDKIIKEIDAVIEKLESRETQKSVEGKPPEKYYTLMVEKGMYRAVLEVIKACFPTLTCELDHKIAPIAGTIEYVMVQLGDYSSYFPSIPTPTMEDLTKKLPILFFREEGSSYIFARKSAEMRAQMALEALFPESFMEEMLIYSMFTFNERLVCVKDTANFYFDSLTNVLVHGKKINECGKVIFNDLYNVDVEDEVTKESYDIDPTLSINKQNYTLCFFD